MTPFINNSGSSGDPTLPTNAVMVECFGGGAAGGGTTGTSQGGGGGSGASYACGYFSISANQQLDVTGGSAPAGTTGNGVNGTAATVKDHSTGGTLISVSAPGGNGGQSGATGSGGTVPAAGTVSGTQMETGQVATSRTGGRGGFSSGSGGTIASGGGGGGAAQGGNGGGSATTGAGAGAAQGTGNRAGGNGGSGVTSGATAGNPGVSPGGGGSGARRGTGGTNQQGGTGTATLVAISWSASYSFGGLMFAFPVFWLLCGVTAPVLVMKCPWRMATRRDVEMVKMALAEGGFPKLRVGISKRYGVFTRSAGGVSIRLPRSREGDTAARRALHLWAETITRVEQRAA